MDEKLDFSDPDFLKKICPLIEELAVKFRSADGRNLFFNDAPVMSDREILAQAVFRALAEQEELKEARAAELAAMQETGVTCTSPATQFDRQQQ